MITAESFKILNDRRVMLKSGNCGGYLTLKAFKQFAKGTANERISRTFKIYRQTIIIIEINKIEHNHTVDLKRHKQNWHLQSKS